jgi:glycosyltransferase involved in cell wall biosynthesis
MIGWVKAFREKGDEVYVHAILRGPTENYEDIEPLVLEQSKISKMLIKIRGDKGTNSPKAFPKIIKYFRYLKHLNPDVVIVRDISRYFSFIAAVLARLLKIKVMIYSQIPYYSNNSFIRKKLMDLTNFVFNSYWVTPVRGNEKKQKNIPSKLNYLPFAVDIDDKNSEERNQSETFQLLSIGKFYERKNHILLLKVLLKLKNEEQKLRLTIIGENAVSAHQKYYNEVVDFIKKNYLKEDVCIMVNVNNTEINKYYKENDVCVLPATNEPACISVLEAMGNLCPIICSNTNGTSYYVKDGMNGYLFKNNDEDDLYRCIKKAMNTNFSKNEMLEFAEKNISKNNFYLRFIEIIKKY